MSRKRNLQPLFLVLVFFGPMILAAIAYYGPWDFAPGAPRGELIDRPVPALQAVLAERGGNGTPTEAVRSRWSLIYARTAPCSEECLEHLIRIFQVRLALGADRERVQLVLLFAGPQPPIPPDSGWVMARLDDAAGRRMVEALDDQRIRNGRVYVADPRGHLVVTYPLGAQQQDMLQDLQRLLKLSAVP